MNNNNIYKSRMVGGMAVIAMPKGTAGNGYIRTEGKGGVIYLRPVKDDKSNRLKEDLALSELALATVGM